MNYSTTPRSQKLTGLVQSIWCYQAEPAHEFEHVQAGVNSQLLVNLHEHELRHWTDPHRVLRTTGPVAAQGLLTTPLLIDTKQKRNVCGVAFSSYGLSAFCNASASLFTDSIVDATELWGQRATGLRDSLVREADPVERCRLIESFLVEHLICRDDENRLLEHILCSMQSGVTISAIRRKTGLSQRALHNLFERRIGVRPKIFARVDRFNSTLGPLSDDVPLTEIALSNGFSDQPHFTREFRHFSGNAPTHHQPLTNECHHAHVTSDKLFKTSNLR